MPNGDDTRVDPPPGGPAGPDRAVTRKPTGKKGGKKPTPKKGK